MGIKFSNIFTKSIRMGSFYNFAVYDYDEDYWILTPKIDESISNTSTDFEYNGYGFSLNSNLFSSTRSFKDIFSMEGGYLQAPLSATTSVSREYIIEVNFPEGIILDYVYIDPGINFNYPGFNNGILEGYNGEVWEVLSSLGNVRNILMIPIEGRIKYHSIRLRMWSKRHSSYNYVVLSKLHFLVKK